MTSIEVGRGQLIGRADRIEGGQDVETRSSGVEAVEDFFGIAIKVEVRPANPSRDRRCAHIQPRKGLGKLAFDGDERILLLRHAESL